MHHLICPGFNKYFLVGNQPCLFDIVNKHWSCWENNFKLHKTIIELLLRRTNHQTPLCFHDIIPCIFFTHKGFTFCFHILINVKSTQQVRCLRENNFHYNHQCWIFVGNNNLRDCITFQKNTSKPFQSPNNIVCMFSL